MILTKIQEAAARYPDTIALQIKIGDRYRAYPYRELLAVTASVAKSLAGLGIGKGDRVAILSENRPEWMFTYLAVAALGAIVVPLDAQLTEKETAVLLADCEAKAVCVSASTRQKLPKGSFTILSFDPGDGVAFSGMLTAFPAAQFPAAPLVNDPAALLYTSGTTGDPKGVLLTHGNLSSNCAGLIQLKLFSHADNFLSLLPLHHTYPAMGCILLPLSLGATVTMLNSLKGPDILATMQETGVSVMIGVPQLYTALNRAIFDEIKKKSLLVRWLAQLFLGFNSLLRKTAGVNIGKALFGTVHAKFGPRFRFFASGGARLEPDVYTGMTNLGFTVIEGYGLTETSPVCAFNPLTKQKAGSIGVMLPGVEVRIADPDEHGRGELAVRGPNVMAGYYKKPGATAEAIREGWFYTGDLGYRDKDGYFFITGRSKEMIVLSTGKKIFPDELEKYYKQIPSIKEFCLIQGERGLEAAVVPDFDYLRRMNLSNSRETISAEIEDLARDLPPYKRIMGLKIFKEPFPVTRLGKLKRAMVRDLYGKGAKEAEASVLDEEAELLHGPVGRKVLNCLEHFIEKKKILSSDNLELDLGLDSLARVELVVSLDQTFGVKLPDSFGSEVFTVKDAVLSIQKILELGGPGAGAQARLSWSEILRQEPSGDAEDFLRLKPGALCAMGAFLFQAMLRVFYALYGRLSIRGLENIPPDGPFIIAVNHLSFADAPLVMAALPWKSASRTYSLGHTKYFGGPVTSIIAKVMQVIPVDMETRLIGAMQLSAYVLRKGKVLLVFPEGSRSRDGMIKEYKKGVGILAKELNVPIVPAAIKGTFEMLPTGKAFPRFVKVGVSFGKPINPGEMDYDGIVKRLYGETVGMMVDR